LTQLSAANTGKPEENSELMNEIAAPQFTADFCVCGLSAPLSKFDRIWVNGLLDRIWVNMEK
jgi:hypothetical protein